MENPKLQKIARNVANRNTDLIASVLLLPSVQGLIHELRDKYNIPKKSFVIDQDKPDTTTLTDWRTSMGMSDNCWNYLDIPKPKREFYRPLDNDFGQAMNNNISTATGRWVSDFELLTALCQLEEHFRPNMERYTLINEITAPLFNFYKAKLIMQSGPRWQRAFRFVVFGKITTEEWRLIKHFATGIPYLHQRRYRKRTNRSRDLEIIDQSLRKRKGTFRTDKEMAAHITAFADNESTVDNAADDKRAKVIKTARFRAKKRLKEKIGRDA